MVEDNLPCTMKMPAILQQAWNEHRCPIVNGVTFADGRVQEIESHWVTAPSGRLELQIQRASSTTLDAIDTHGKLLWSEIDVLCREADSARNIVVFGGEGGMGTDGFVALTKGNASSLCWIAFFDHSNPFETIQLRGDHVWAKTNLGVWWCFPIQSPDCVTISASNE